MSTFTITTQNIEQAPMEFGVPGEAQKISIPTLSQKHFALLEAYTGIDSDLLDNPDVQNKVDQGLNKQLELIAALHGPGSLEVLKNIMNNYYSDPTYDITSLTQNINSLLVYGQIQDIQGSGYENLHSELGHFWRILGWEELQGQEQMQTKLLVGSIDEVEKSCGNLIRTLELLTEYWQDLGIGPKLIFPNGKPVGVKTEITPVYATTSQKGYPNATSVLTLSDKSYPSEANRPELDALNKLIAQLMTKYPMEHAFAIFDYYCQVNNLDSKGYNLAMVQEYINNNGEKYIKGILSGNLSVVHVAPNSSKTYEAKLAASINGNSHVGSSHNTGISLFDIPVSNEDVINVVQGTLASQIHQAAIAGTLNLIGDHPKNIYAQLQALTKQLGVSKFQKPIISIKAGQAQEQQLPLDLVSVEDAIIQSSKPIATWLRTHNIDTISLEAGHIHADRKPTNLQKLGIKIGSYLQQYMENMLGLEVIAQPMIDEDHVLNILNHQEYVNLMKRMNFVPNEVIWESSPVIREIGTSITKGLLDIYPEQFELKGSTLVFNVPGTDLIVEIIKDINQEPFEFGCVLFDAALTMYRIYPELANLYSTDQTGKSIHEGMLGIYNQYDNPLEKSKVVKEAFPYKT
ncbi:MAG: hypothetical protein US52_C0005G0001, partial [candidate division WS6 bacterium GW2011_GWA2_37_6]